MTYRLTINPALERSNTVISRTFACISQLDLVKEFTADLLLFLQDEIGVMEDYSNYFFVEELVGGVWEELESD